VSSSLGWGKGFGEEFARMYRKKRKKMCVAARKKMCVAARKKMDMTMRKNMHMTARKMAESKIIGMPTVTKRIKCTVIVDHLCLT
jgi:hypothetical protein